MSRPPKVSFQIVRFDQADLVEFARAADELGVEAFWIPEHYIRPGARLSTHPGNHGGGLAPPADERMWTDPWVQFGALSAVTTRLRFGASVCIAPLLHPLHIARAAATVAQASGGRFTLGVGAGWMREEFAAFGVPFEGRGARLDEAIQVLRKAWRGGYFEHHGASFDFQSLQIAPEPVQVPLLCGGNVGPGLERAARDGDAWMNSWTISLDEALALRSAIEAARRRHGRTGEPFTYYIRPSSTDPAEIARFVNQGFEHFSFYTPDIWPTGRELGAPEKRQRLEQFLERLGALP